MEHVKYEEMILLHQTSNFKLQTSDKLQTSKVKEVWFLVIGYFLVFDVWCLDFVSEGDD